jgi:hypothetical protein
VRHRGQYCHVAALLPGRSDPTPPHPTPILRLRDPGSADHWAIAIYCRMESAVRAQLQGLSLGNVISYDLCRPGEAAGR